MNKNLKDYVCIYRETFSSSYCDLVLEEINKLDWQKHSYARFTADSDLEQSQFENELDVTYQSFSQTNAMTADIWKVVNRYVLHDMNPNENGFNGWQGFTLPRFNRYLPGTLMRTHCDHIKGIFDGERKGIPILSIVGSLNDGYEGGEFLMWGEPVELKKGDIMVFPSNFLYPHSVTPVTSGVRYSFVSWVW